MRRARLSDGERMRVLLIANYGPDRQESMQRFAGVLHSELLRRGLDVRVAAPRCQLGRAADGVQPAAKWRGYLDKYVLFRRDLVRVMPWANVVHICDHSNSHYARWLQGTPHLVTCHDLIAVRSALGELPEHRTRWSGRQLQRLILSGLQQAQRVVCVSEATRADVLRLTGQPTSCVGVVPNGLNYPFAPMDELHRSARLERLGISNGRRFLLHVGGNAWYKNREGVLQIFAALLRRGVDAELVLVGQPLSAKLREMIDTWKLGDRIREVVGPDNEDLRALYSSARALLFPSLYEGFGWPIIEAQACGCPVITSQRAPMPEVAGRHALLVPPQDPERAATSISESWDALGTQRSEGIANAACFSVAAMVDGYLHEYRAAMA